MRIIHTIGYALAALVASGVGVAMMGDLSIWGRMGVMAFCAVLGAFVGWNRGAK